MISENPTTEGKTKRSQGWRGILAQGLLLMGLWLVLSGHYDIFHIACGVLSVGVILLMNRRLSSVQFFPDDVFEWEQVRFYRLIFFLPWLIKEIALASVDVASIVLNPKMPVAPALVRFRVNLPSMGAKVTLGNTITLTPGTITLAIEGDEFLVHAIREGSASSLENGAMPLSVARLFHGKSKGAVSEYTVIKSGKDL